MALRHCEFAPSSIILNICLVSQQLDAVREGFCFVSDWAPQVWSLLGVILFSSVSPSDWMTEWCPPALVCANFFTQFIKSMLISSFDNWLKLLIRSILHFLWLSLVYLSVIENIIYYIDDFTCFFPVVVSLHFYLFVRFHWQKLALENWKVLLYICFIF